MFSTELKKKAWVVFCSNTDIKWLRVFKKDFRHCFLILNDGRNWITYDPLSSYTDITVQRTPLDFDLPKWFENKGDIVVSTYLKKCKKTAPISVFSCVEGVKRVLCIHNRWILTPYQLYKYLNSTKKKRN